MYRAKNAPPCRLKPSVTERPINMCWPTRRSRSTSPPYTRRANGAGQPRVVGERREARVGGLRELAVVDQQLVGRVGGGREHEVPGADPQLLPAGLVVAHDLIADPGEALGEVGEHRQVVLARAQQRAAVGGRQVVDRQRLLAALGEVPQGTELPHAQAAHPIQLMLRRVEGEDLGQRFEPLYEEGERDRRGSQGGQGFAPVQESVGRCLVA